ncbi:MAG: signal peptidase I [Clostridia bacterium]|nr:signal peptidase I [Clostridia bacterium]
MAKKVKYVLGSLLIIAFIFVLIYTMTSRITGKTPSLFGYSFLRISSASMEPELNVGDVILVKSTEPKNLSKGDTISYLGREDSFKGKIITHKIVSEPKLVNGTYYFTTRGINNCYLDDPEIDETQLVGKFVYKARIISFIYSFFSKWYGLLTFMLLVVLAFSSEIITLVKIIRGCDEDDSAPQQTE